MSILFANGFRAAGYASGIKESGNLDLSLVAVDGTTPAITAATFTQNLAAAAPVQVSKEHMKKSFGRIHAVILSSGNANAATGVKGMNDAVLMCQLVADNLGISPDQVLLCSTGLIGIPMPTDKFVSGIPNLVKKLNSLPASGVDAARAIMTTDTKEKLVEEVGSNFRIGGMAKGAAMLAPNMATMLAVLTTDATIDQGELTEILGRAVSQSFNRLVIDNCTSTNDTVICMSSAKSEKVDLDEFEQVLTKACTSLAMQMALDAEGATKCVRVKIAGALTDYDADLAARKVASSQLVQCSFYGCDPYWGRLASEIGSAGIEFKLDRLKVSYGNIVVAESGVTIPANEVALRSYMLNRDLEVICDLGLGDGCAEVITTDLSPDYIAENMRTS